MRPAIFSRVAFAAVALSAAAAVPACSSEPLADSAEGAPQDTDADPCATPNDGCPCDTPGQQIECGTVMDRSDDSVTCAEGHRTCGADGTWGACVAQQTVIRNNPESTGDGLHTAGLGVPKPCVKNPCDPTCAQFPDSCTGLDAGSSLTCTDGGWTLTGTVAGPTTITLTGKVEDPAALNPIFNAAVAVPGTGSPPGSGSPPAIPTGVPLTDACGGTSFKALAATYSAKDGTFTLKGVPVQSSVNLIAQVGRWRRLVNLNTSKCIPGNTYAISPTGSSSQLCGGSTTLGPCDGANVGYAGSAGCMTRLPRRQSEGNIEHIALVSGNCDSMECLLYRMGVSSSEFTDEGGSGRVHFFYGHGAGGPGANHTLPYLAGFNAGIQDFGFETTCGTPTLQGHSGWWYGTESTDGAGQAYCIKSWRSQGTYSLGLGDWGPFSYCGRGDCGTDNYDQTFTAPAGTTQLWVDVAAWCGGPSTSGFKTILTDLTANAQYSSGYRCWYNPFFLTTGTVKWTGLTAGHTYTLSMSNYDWGWGNIAAFDNVRLLNSSSKVISNTTPSNLLNNYDLVMLPCDCGYEYNWGWGYNVDEPGRQNLQAYGNKGGRIFTSHWGREWIERPGQTLTSGPFPGVASWYPWSGKSGCATSCGGCSGQYGCVGAFGCGGNSSGCGTSDPGGYFDTASARGASFASWMGITTGNSTRMSVSPTRYDAKSLTGNAVRFVFGRSDNAGNTSPDEAFDFTFDTPVGGSPQYGRMMFTDMHLASMNSGVNTTTGWGFGGYRFPSECPAQGSALTAQEKAAEYLLFDLGQCITGQPVLPPAPVYNATTFVRDFKGVCPSGLSPVWHKFNWTDATPGDSNISFVAYTADTQAQLETQYPKGAVLTWSGTCSCASKDGPCSAITNPACTSGKCSKCAPNNSASPGVDVDTLLKAPVSSGGGAVPTWLQPPVGSRTWLRVKMTLTPSSSGANAPTLYTWNQAFDCVPNQ